jgi:hypothetical protein
MSKATYIIGFPIISKLIRGHTVELEDVCFIPDSQLFNESKNNYGCVSFEDASTSKSLELPTKAPNSHYTAALCKRCPYSGQCKSGEQPGSNHCFAVLQRLNPLEAADCV